MHYEYDDIITRIGERPKWWDANAVPRFCDFAPGEQADIYCSEAVLLLISCQACGHKFKVAMTSSFAARATEAICERLPDGPEITEPEFRAIEAATLAQAIRDGSIHWGDPPSYFQGAALTLPGGHCCHSGATMNCNDLKVLEYWSRDARHRWVRDPSLEIELPDLKELGSAE